jgi:protein-disulfide isomerase
MRATSDRASERSAVSARGTRGRGLKSLAVLGGIVGAVLLSGSDPGFSQGGGDLDDLKALGQEIKTVRDGQRGIRREVQQLKFLLIVGSPVPPPVPKDIVIDIKGAWARGEKTAKLTIVEFMDYQCPLCGRHFRDVLPQIERDYIGTGKVRYVLLDYPGELVHPNAMKAAQAARCAGDQGKFWEMHDRLLANQGALKPNDLPEHARALGLDVPRFEQCVDSDRFEDEIRSDIDTGLKAGVRATPSFYLGSAEQDGNLVRVRSQVPGAAEWVAFKPLIDKLLLSEK